MHLEQHTIFDLHNVHEHFNIYDPVKDDPMEKLIKGLFSEQDKAFYDDRRELTIHYDEYKEKLIEFECANWELFSPLFRYFIIREWEHSRKLVRDDTYMSVSI